MWTPHSVCRWICLLTLAVVMLSAVSEVGCFGLSLDCNCPGNLTSTKIRVIKCVEQIERLDCPHAFVIEGKIPKHKRIRMFCIKPDAPWLTEQIKEKCPPDLEL